MPSLVFTTLVPRFSKAPGGGDNTFPTPELADSASSHPTLLLGLIISIFLVIVFLLSYTYRILAGRKEDKLRSSLQPTKSKNASHSRDIEKGSDSLRGLKDRISGPTLLFGTSMPALDDFVNRESKPHWDMDITDARFEHVETSFLAIENGHSDILHAREHVTDTLKACGDVSPSKGEDIQIARTICSVTESGYPTVLEDAPIILAADTPKHNVIMSNGKGGKYAGLTENGLDSTRDLDDPCDDIIGIMTALERLADTFNALDSFETGVGIGQNENGVRYEECGITNVREPGDTCTAIQQYEKLGELAYPSSDITRPYSTFDSKEDARAVLACRRVELQTKHELASVLNPVARDPDSYKRAVEPGFCPLKPMRPESVLKEKRCADARRRSKAYRPALTSPLASGFVICGPDFSWSKPHRTGSRKPAPFRRRTKSLSPTTTSRHGCGLAHSSSISRRRSSDKLAVHLLKRRQSQANADLKSSSSRSISSNAAKSQAGGRRGVSPATTRSSPLFTPSTVTQQAFIDGRDTRHPSRPAPSPVYFEKRTRTIMNAGVDCVLSMADPGLQSIPPKHSDEVEETLSVSTQDKVALTSVKSPVMSLVMTLIMIALPHPSLALSIKHINHHSDKAIINFPSSSTKVQDFTKKPPPCAFARMQVVPGSPQMDNSSSCSSSTPSRNSKTHKTATKVSSRKHCPSSPAVSESRIYRGPPTVARITHRDHQSPIDQNVSLPWNVMHCELVPAVSSATPPVKRRVLADISNSTVVNRSAASSRYSPLAVRLSIVFTSRSLAATHTREFSGSSSNTTRTSKHPQLARRSLAGAPPRSLAFPSSTSAMH